MTIDEAIGILKDISSPAPQVNPLDSREAIKLGIEALKYRKHLKDEGIIMPGFLLPGETPETSNPAAEEYLKRLKESPLGRDPKG